MRIGFLDMVMMPKGVTVPWDQVYRNGAETGLAGMEPGLMDNYADTLLWSAEGRKYLRSAAVSAGMQTPSICMHSFWFFSFASPDPEKRRRARSIAEEAARAAAEMGARNILVPLTNPDDLARKSDARRRWIDGIASCARAAEEAGVVYCLENVNQPFANTADDLVRIVDAVDSPAVQVYFDPANAVRDGIDPVASIRRLGSRIKQVHVKQIGGKGLDEGPVAWQPIVDALAAAAYDGWLVLETDPVHDPMPAAGNHLRTLTTMLGKGN